MRAQQIYKDEPTKRAIKLMEQAKKNAKHFVTGNPIKVIKYGVYEDKTLSFVSFETTGGVEDVYWHSDCLAMAVQDSSKIIYIK